MSHPYLAVSVTSAAPGSLRRPISRARPRRAASVQRPISSTTFTASMSCSSVRVRCSSRSSGSARVAPSSSAIPRRSATGKLIAPSCREAPTSKGVEIAGQHVFLWKTPNAANRALPVEEGASIRGSGAEPKRPVGHRRGARVRAGRRGYRPALVPCTKSVLQSHVGSCHSKTTTVQALYNGQITLARVCRYLFVISFLLSGLTPVVGFSRTCRVVSFQLSGSQSSCRRGRCARVALLLGGSRVDVPCGGGVSGGVAGVVDAGEPSCDGQ